MNQTLTSRSNQRCSRQRAAGLCLHPDFRGGKIPEALGPMFFIPVLPQTSFEGKLFQKMLLE